MFWQTTVTVLHIIVTVALIAIVLLQTGKDAGLSGSIGGSGSDTFFGKNRGRTWDALFEKLTTVIAILFVITSLVLSIAFNA